MTRETGEPILMGPWTLMAKGYVLGGFGEKRVAAWKGPTNSYSRFSIDPDGDILDIPGGWMHANVRNFLAELKKTPRAPEVQENLETMISNGEAYWKKFLKKPPAFDPDDLVCGRIGTNEGTGLYFLGDSDPTPKQYKAIIDFLDFLAAMEKYTSKRGIRMTLDTGGRSDTQFSSIGEAKEHIQQAYGMGKLKKEKSAPYQSLVQQFHVGGLRGPVDGGRRKSAVEREAIRREVINHYFEPSGQMGNIAVDRPDVTGAELKSRWGLLVLELETMGYSFQPSPGLFGGVLDRRGALVQDITLEDILFLMAAFGQDAVVHKVSGDEYPWMYNQKEGKKYRGAGTPKFGEKDSPLTDKTMLKRDPAQHYFLDFDWDHPVQWSLQSTLGGVWTDVRSGEVTPAQILGRSTEPRKKRKVGN